MIIEYSFLIITNNECICSFYKNKLKLLLLLLLWYVIRNFEDIFVEYIMSMMLSIIFSEKC